MIILYIPFHEENDLLILAVNWKEALKEQNILILQHGNPIPYKLMEKEHLTIYVLAHGVDNLLAHFRLASNYPITPQTTHLGIDKIAERFNSDFIYLHHKVGNIKLYFCNNKGNQKSIAEKFHSHLILFDALIHYYAGTLYSPSEDKKKYSRYQGQWYASSKVRNILQKRATRLDLNQQMSIKAQSMFRFFDHAKQQRIDSILQKRKKTRLELVMQKRKETLIPQKPDAEEKKAEERNESAGLYR